MEVTEHAGEIIITEMLLNQVKKETAREREQEMSKALICQCSYCRLFLKDILEDKSLEGRPDIMLFHCLRRSGRLSNQNEERTRRVFNTLNIIKKLPGRKGQVQ